MPLPPEVHEGLREQSKRLGTPATVLAREAISEWVTRLKREQLREEIRKYARANAGSSDDLDEVFETAALEAWPAEDE